MSAWEELFTAKSVGLSEERFQQFRADYAALRDLYREQAQFQLRLGDRFNELKARWNEKVALVASAASVPRRSILQWGRVAAQIPPDDPLRATKLPYAILRLLAPLSQPERERWAAEAVALRDRKELRPREFAQRLEEAGLRQPRRRAPRPAPCLYCERETGGSPERIEWRDAEEAGWTCSRRCLIAYLKRLERQRPSGAGPSGFPSPSPGRETHPRPGGAGSPVETRSLNPARESPWPTSPPEGVRESQSQAAKRGPMRESQSAAAQRETARESHSQAGDREAARESPSGPPERDCDSESQSRSGERASPLPSAEREETRESQKEQRIYMRGRFIGVWKSRPRWGGGPRPATKTRAARSHRSCPARPPSRPGTRRRAPVCGAASRPLSSCARAPPCLTALTRSTWTGRRVPQRARGMVPGGLATGRALKLPSH